MLVQFFLFSTWNCIQRSWIDVLELRSGLHSAYLLFSEHFQYKINNNKYQYKTISKPVTNVALILKLHSKTGYSK